jgi:hypothetical protein
LPPGQTHRPVELAVLGALTKDQKGCTDETGHVHPVGTRYYREHGHHWICAAPRIEEQADRCFLALGDLPQHLHQPLTPPARIARALDHGLSDKAQQIDAIPSRIVDTAQEVADGRVTLQTAADALSQKATDLAQHANADDAKSWLKQQLDHMQDWAQKPPIEQAEDLATELGDSLLPHPATLLGAALAGPTSRSLLHAASEAEDLAKASKKVRKATAKAEHKAAKKAAHAKPPHGNRADDRPATRYIKVDKDDQLLKHGVTQHEDPRKRYTREQVGEGRVKLMERGPRKEMLKKERDLVETNPGPENREPWAGKRRQRSDGQQEP